MCGYVVMIFDFDVLGYGWWYWVVVGILVIVMSLLVDVSVFGFLCCIGVSEVCNDFGIDGYGGLCLLFGKLYCYVIIVYVLKGIDLCIL